MILAQGKMQAKLYILDKIHRSFTFFHSDEILTVKSKIEKSWTKMS